MMVFTRNTTSAEEIPDVRQIVQGRENTVRRRAEGDGEGCAGRVFREIHCCPNVEMPM